MDAHTGPRHSAKRHRAPRLAACAAALAVAAAGSAVAATAERADASAPLRTHADAIGKHIGTGVDPDRMRTDPEYRRIVVREFNAVTPRHVMTWEVLQPAQGQWQFGPADAAVDAARTNGQLVRGNALVSHERAPYWLRQLPGQMLHAAMTSHIDTVVSRYRGDVAHWDVVDEPLADDGGFRDSFWYRALGADYIADALRQARRADPAADLYLDEYGVAGTNAKSDALYALAGDLLAHGVPLDGVGLQGHLVLGQVPSDLRQNLQRFTDLGLDVSLSELEIVVPLPPSEVTLQRQAQDYRAVVTTCVYVAGCHGVSLWEIVDSDTGWLPGPDPFGAGAPWFPDFTRKPAYDAIHDALAGTTPTPVS